MAKRVMKKRKRGKGGESRDCMDGSGSINCGTGTGAGLTGAGAGQAWDRHIPVPWKNTGIEVSVSIVRRQTTALMRVKQ